MTPSERPNDPISQREQQWQPIETAPKMRKVIVTYINAAGKRRTVMACYYKAHSLEMHDDYTDVGEYDEKTGESYAPEGWYEEHDHEDPIMTLNGEPTHWMPLPAPPEEAALQASSQQGVPPSVETEGPDAVPFVDTLVLKAKRAAFDRPTIANLDALIEAVRLSVLQPTEQNKSNDKIWERIRATEAASVSGLVPAPQLPHDAKGSK